MKVREKIILISSCGECPHCGTDKDVNIACKMLDLDNYGRKIPGNNTPNWCPLPDAGYRLPTLDVEKMKAFKFLRDDMRSGSGNEPAWVIGEKRTIKGKLELCYRGYHSSPSWYDALNYAPGNMACIVEVSKPTEKQADKQVSHSCTIIQAVNVEKSLRAYACDCAERALSIARVTNERIWNAIKVARLYNENKATKDELDHSTAAAYAANAAAYAASPSAYYAAAYSVDYAVYYAAHAADAYAAYYASSFPYKGNNLVEWQRQHLNKLLEKEF